MAITHDKKSYRSKRIKIGVLSILGALVVSGIVAGVIIGINAKKADGLIEFKHKVFERHAAKSVIGVFRDENGFKQEFDAVVAIDGSITFDLSAYKGDRSQLKLVQIIDKNKPINDLERIIYDINQQIGIIDHNRDNLNKEISELSTITLKPQNIITDSQSNFNQTIDINLTGLETKNDLNNKIVTAYFSDTYDATYQIETKVINNHIILSANSLDAGTKYVLNKLKVNETNQEISVALIQNKKRTLGNFFKVLDDGNIEISARVPDANKTQPIKAIFINTDPKKADHFELIAHASNRGFVNFNTKLINRPGKWILNEIHDSNSTPIVVSEQLVDDQKIEISAPKILKIMKQTGNKLNLTLEVSTIFANKQLIATFRKQDGSKEVLESASSVNKKGFVVFNGINLANDVVLEKIEVKEQKPMTTVLRVPDNSILTTSIYPTNARRIISSFNEKGETIIKIKVEDQYKNQKLTLFLSEHGNETEKKYEAVVGDDGIIEFNLFTFENKEAIYKIKQIIKEQPNANHIVVINEQTLKEYEKLTYHSKVFTVFEFNNPDNPYFDLFINNDLIFNQFNEVLKSSQKNKFSMDIELVYVNDENKFQTIKAQYLEDAQKFFISYKDIKLKKEFKPHHFNVKWIYKGDDLAIEQSLFDQVEIKPIKQYFELTMIENKQSSISEEQTAEFKIKMLNKDINKDYKMRAVLVDENNNYIFSDEQTLNKSKNTECTFSISKTSHNQNQNVWKPNKTFKLIGIEVYEKEPLFDGSLAATNNLIKHYKNIKSTFSLTINPKN